MPTPELTEERAPLEAAALSPEESILREERELLGEEVQPEPPVQDTAPEAAAPIPPPLLDPQDSAIDARDREFLAALGAVLEKTRPQPAVPPPAPAESPVEKFAFGVVKKGVGVISLALILIFMGIVLVCTLFSQNPDYLLPLRLAPVAAVLIGLELLAHYLASGKHFRVHIPSIVISALIIVGCCAMACLLNNSYSESTADFNNRSVAAEIYDRSYRELRYVADIADLEIEVDLNPDGTGRKKGMEALMAGDYVVVSCELAGTYSTPKEFASECKGIIDGYRFLDIPVTEYHFINEGKLHRFSLDVEGKFEQDYSESRLTELVDHIYVEDYDYIPDLEDFTGSEESEQTQSAE